MLLSLQKSFAQSWKSDLDINLHKEQEKLFLSIFKELNKQFEKAEEKGYHLSAVTMDYKGSLDPEIDIPNELAIAFNEALGGCLMCIIPGVVTQGIGVGMIVDSATKRPPSPT